MMFKIGSLVVLVAAVGLLATTIPTTVQLARMDVGLRSSLHSTSQLVGIEAAVVQKNKSIGKLVETSADMEEGLQVTKQTTSSLDQNIEMINQLNQSTLSINQSISNGARASADHLASIASNMSALDTSTKGLEATLQALDGIVQQDNNSMSQMKQATASMNDKIPGVLG
ncbi:hypothetical protein NZD89_22450 [Alicyclobacillus fastidiosus]|uniref:Methyl-accepting transducer domain-containing protein n=1 Tax=Alicyclobacillus fastidiosus TaxID=392011 RepID=A0ABY6ZDV1_9BACL|nr:hypothetical protein [Alicyclobacillus fastidiosus]WAH41019.1 hypothetical protein NZD89_22450 [Alicyclobacillus fastidiosus]GMA62541.1 hypothetical protein GCM10025859_29810 [Alicyclobacillus fastidiosus]